MWHALRTELAYFRPWLVGAFALAVGVAALVSGIFRAVGDEGPEPFAATGIRGMFLIMAPLILGFVIQALRAEERRIRLLMAGPLTPRQLAGVSILIPVILLGIGILGAASLLVVDALITRAFAAESLHIVAFVGSLIFMGTMIGLLIQEAVAAYSQGRTRAAVAGWAVFAAGVLVLGAIQTRAVVVQGPLTWPLLHLGNLLVAVAVMPAIVLLFANRSDFTR
jgi:hypothetical protein